jgi:hypothetical protein
MREGSLEIPAGAWELASPELGLYCAPVSASVGGSGQIRLHAYALAVRGGSGGLELQVAREAEAQWIMDALADLSSGDGPFETVYIRAAGDPAKGSGTKCVVWLEPAGR